MLNNQITKRFLATKFAEDVEHKFMKLKRKWRKIVTGDEEKKVRVHLKETQKTPDFIKLFDKISFTVGVLNIVSCQYFLLNLPGWFWMWYSFVMPIILFARYYHFKNLHWEYFLIDFCYFGITCTFISLFVFPNSQRFFNVAFIYAAGPLSTAILAWRNSLVFHDFDKISTLYIHILPIMLFYCGRNYGHYTCSTLIFNIDSTECSLRMQPSSGKYLSIIDYLYAIVGYVFWQVCYYVKTEVMDRLKLDSDPRKLTSLRWLSKDLKNPLCKGILLLCRKIGVFGKDEVFNSDTFKTKFIFMFSQGVYTILTFAVTPFLYASKTLLACYIMLLFTAATYYGAGFYIEVFSKRYQDKFITSMEINDNEVTSVDSKSLNATTITPTAITSDPSTSLPDIKQIKSVNDDKIKMFANIIKDYQARPRREDDQKGSPSIMPAKRKERGLSDISDDSKDLTDDEDESNNSSVDFRVALIESMFDEIYVMIKEEILHHANPTACPNPSAHGIGVEQSVSGGGDAEVIERRRALTKLDIELDD